MNDAIRKYVVSKFMDDIRGKKVINDKLCATINEHKSIAELRNLVTPTDIPLLIDIAKTRSAAFGNIAISMMGQYSLTDPIVKNFLEDLWVNGCSKNYERNHLVMLILMNTPESNTHQEEFFQFIEENFEYFKARIVYYCCGKENVYTFVTSRLKNKVSKEWVYLCCALASDETSLVRTLLNTYIENTTDTFTKNVATRMLARM